MKTLLCLILVFLSVGYDLLGAEAKGLLIYTDHPSTYVESCEFSSLDSTKPAYYQIVRADGQRLQINPGGLWIVVDYPPEDLNQDITDVANQNLARIQELESRFPQFKASLVGADTKWRNALTLKRQIATNASNAQVPETQRKIFLFTRGMQVTSIGTADFAVMSDTGIERVKFQDLPADISMLPPALKESVQKFRDEVALQKAKEENQKMAPGSTVATPFAINNTQSLTIDNGKSLKESTFFPDTTVVSEITLEMIEQYCTRKELYDIFDHSTSLSKDLNKVFAANALTDTVGDLNIIIKYRCDSESDNTPAENMSLHIGMGQQTGVQWNTPLLARNGINLAFSQKNEDDEALQRFIGYLVKFTQLCQHASKDAAAPAVRQDIGTINGIHLSYEPPSTLKSDGNGGHGEFSETEISCLVSQINQIPEMKQKVTDRIEREIVNVDSSNTNDILDDRAIKWLNNRKMGIGKEVGMIIPEKITRGAKIAEDSYGDGRYHITLYLYDLPNIGFLLVKFYEWHDSQDEINSCGIAITYSQLSGFIEALKKCLAWTKTSVDEKITGGIEKVAYDDQYLKAIFITPDRILCQSTYTVNDDDDNRKLDIRKADTAAIIRLLCDAPNDLEAYNKRIEEGKMADANRKRDIETLEQAEKQKMEEDKKKVDSLLK